MCRTSLIVAVLVWAATSAAAQDPPEVPVDVEVRVPGMRSYWHESRVPGITGAVRDGLVATLAQRWPYWRFRGRRAGEPALLVFAVEESERVLRLRLDLVRPSGAAASPLRAVWKAPADLSLTGYPFHSAAADEIVRAFTTRLLDSSAIEVSELLRAVPVAHTAQWLGQPADLRIVLPLAWERHKRLGHSIFLVDCDWPSMGRAQLESVAPGLPATFQPAPPGAGAPYPAVMVVPRVRQYLNTPERVDAEPVRTQLGQLTLRAVFLKRYVEPLEWEIAPPPPGGQP